MLRASIHLVTIRGIPIGLHYSWFLIAALITLSLGTQFAATQPSWGAPLVWTAALVTALLFFVSLVAHEMSHAVMAQSVGLPVRAITLFALGGVAQIDKEASTARSEFAIAIVGPLASLAIGFACLWGGWALGWTLEASTPSVGGAILGWLGYINIVLAVFNMIPAFPLDGGRVLRALLWSWSGSAPRATQLAARVGQAAAFGFIMLGLLSFFMGAGFSGLWLAFIGWFLLEAAQASHMNVTVNENLRDVRVADVMGSDCAMVDAGWSLQRLVDELFLRSGRRCAFVQDHDRAIGLITPSEVRQVERERWPMTSVAEAARPMHLLHTVTPQTLASEALRIMSQEDVHQLPVMANGHLQGIVTRAHVLQLVQTRSALNP